LLVAAAPDWGVPAGLPGAPIICSKAWTSRQLLAASAAGAGHGAAVIGCRAPSRPLQPDFFAAPGVAGPQHAYWCARVIHYPPLSTGTQHGGGGIRDEAAAAVQGAEVERSVGGGGAGQGPLLAPALEGRSPQPSEAAGPPAHLPLGRRASRRQSNPHPPTPFRRAPARLRCRHKCVPVRAPAGLLLPLTLTPTPTPTPQVQLSCGEHTDYGLLTFVNQEPHMTALQVGGRPACLALATPGAPGPGSRARCQVPWLGGPNAVCSAFQCAAVCSAPQLGPCSLRPM
jgi:hypothetical protein